MTKAGLISFRLVLFLVITSLLTALTAFAALEVFLPGQLLRPTVLVPLGLALVVISTLLSARAQIPSRRRPSGLLPSTADGNRETLVVCACILLFLVYFTAWYGMRQAGERSVLLRAREHFQVVCHGDIGKPDVDSTLVELERRLSQLRSKYDPPETQWTVRVELYPSKAELGRITLAPERVLGFITWREGTVVLHLTAEARGQLAGGRLSSAPGHEVAHLVVLECLGPDFMHRVPIWFHEGLAVYESVTGFWRSPDRVLARLTLWLGRTEILEKEQAVLESASYGEEGAPIFYIAAFEFIDCLVVRYGSDVVPQILSRVAQGMPFERAFQAEVGIPVEEAFQRWLDSFF